MLIKTQILKDANGNTDEWQFEVNDNGYINLSVDGMYVDTMYDVGQIKDVKHLEEIVKRLLESWKAIHKDLWLKL